MDAEWFVEDVEWDAVRMSAQVAAGASPSTGKSSGDGPKSARSTQRGANTCCQVRPAKKRGQRWQRACLACSCRDVQ